MTATYYDALGVSPAADTVVITAAYRAMMRKHHPDLNRDPAAEATAKSVTAAYEILSDPARRAAYDRTLAAAANARAANTQSPEPETAYWPTPPHAPEPVRAAAGARGRRAITVLAVVMVIGAGGFGARYLAGGGGSALAHGAATKAQGFFALLQPHGSTSHAAGAGGCAAGLNTLWKLPGELKNSFGDLSQILKAAPPGGDGDGGGMEVIRIAPQDPCAARPPEASARSRRVSTRSRSLD
jgi:curved DNA-binding protein CbpA